MSRRLAAYLRVSTEEQGERGTIWTQRVELLAWANRRGDVEVEFFEHAGWSGTLRLEDRPKARRILRALQDGSPPRSRLELDRPERDPLSGSRHSHARVAGARPRRMVVQTKFVDSPTRAWSDPPGCSVPSWIRHNAFVRISCSPRLLGNQSLQSAGARVATRACCSSIFLHCLRTRSAARLTIE